MNNPFEEIFKRLENIEKMISPVISSSSEEPDSKQFVLVKISVASRITGYSVNYLYHLASSGAIPCVKRLELLCTALHRINTSYPKTPCVLHLTYMGRTEKKGLFPLSFYRAGTFEDF